jgi:hypothetical protein
MEIDPGKQLFIDDYFIESLSGAHRVLHRPQKLTVERPLAIALDRPWEDPHTQFGRVIYDEAQRTFRTYYAGRVGERTVTCVQISQDGLHWERPSLGLVECDGSQDNNIVSGHSSNGWIFWDPYATDEAYRWKWVDHMPSGVGPGGERVWQAAHSADGFAWQLYPPGPYSRQKQFFGFGAPAQSFGGPVNPDARYVGYSQRGSNRRTRVLGRRDSEDALNWSGLRTVIEQDLGDPVGTEFYGAAFDLANRTTGGLHIMMLHTFLTDLAERHEIENPDQYWGRPGGGPKTLAARIEGLVDTQLAVSRDTMAWTRYREPFIPRGEPGAWDWGMLYSDAPLLHEGRLWFFYLGFALSHNGKSAQTGQPRYAAGQNVSAKGVATLRPDGYVSIEADSWAPGILTTHRFRQESGGALHVNVDATAGELRYELLEDNGQPLPGYTAAECDPIRGDALRAPLSWRGEVGWPKVSEAQLARLPGLQKTEWYIKLRFYLYPGTKLYAVTLDPPEVALWGSQVRGRVD